MNWNESPEDKAERLTRNAQRKLERDMDKRVTNAVQSVPPPTVDNSELREILSRSPYRHEQFAATTGVTSGLQKRAQAAFEVEATQKEQAHISSRLSAWAGHHTSYSGTETTAFSGQNSWSGGNPDLWYTQREAHERSQQPSQPSSPPGLPQDVQPQRTPADIEATREEAIQASEQGTTPDPRRTASGISMRVTSTGVASELITGPVNQSRYAGRQLGPTELSIVRQLSLFGDDKYSMLAQQTSRVQSDAEIETYRQEQIALASQQGTTPDPRRVERALANRHMVQDPETGRLVPTFAKEEFLGAKRDIAPTSRNIEVRDMYAAAGLRLGIDRALYDLPSGMGTVKLRDGSSHSVNPIGRIPDREGKILLADGSMVDRNTIDEVIDTEGNTLFSSTRASGGTVGGPPQEPPTATTAAPATDPDDWVPRRTGRPVPPSTAQPQAAGGLAGGPPQEPPVAIAAAAMAADPGEWEPNRSYRPVPPGTTQPGPGRMSAHLTEEQFRQQAIWQGFPRIFEHMQAGLTTESLPSNWAIGIRRGYGEGLYFSGHDPQDVTLSTQGVQQGLSVARMAIHKASIGSYGGKSASAAVANALHRANEAVRHWSDDQIKEIDKLDQDPEIKRAAKENIHKIRQVAQRLIRNVSYPETREVGAPEAHDLMYGAQRVTPAELEAMAAQSGPVGRAISEQIQAMGGMGAVREGGGIFTGGEGPGAPSYRVFGAGPGDGGGGGGYRPRGFWGGMGNLGQVLYASYIAKRFWGYTGAPVLQAMQGYQEWAGGIAPGAGVGAGYATAVAANAELIRGQQAYNMFGPIAQLPSSILAEYEPLGNLANIGQVSAGLGIGAMAMRSPFITGMLPGGAEGAAAGAIGGVSAAMGYGAAGLMGAGLGFELGKIFMPERTKGLTWPKMIVAALGSDVMMGEKGASWVREQQWFKDMALSAAGSPFTAGREELFQALSPKLGLASTDDQLKQYVQQFEALTGKRIEARSLSASQLVTIIRQARDRGQDPLQAMQAGAAFASARGYLPGQREYIETMQEYSTYDLAKQQVLAEDQARVSGRLGMFNQFTPTGLAPEQATAVHQWAHEQAARYTSDWQAQRGFQGMALGMQMGMGYQAAADFGFDLSRYTYTQQQQVMTGISTYVPEIDQTGFGQSMFANLLAPTFAGMTPEQMRLLQGVAAGDLGAASYAARSGVLPPAYQFLNERGRPLYETDFGGWLQTGVGQALQGTPVGPGFIGALSSLWMPEASLSSQDAVRGFFQAEGVNAPDWITKALAKGGMIDVRRVARQQQYDRQMASLGLQYQGIAARQEYLWGGGEYTGVPKAGSLWGLQDTLRGAQYQAAMAGFAETQQQMQMQNVFAMRGEALQQQRMDVTQGYQRWGLGFQQEGMALNRLWTRENWQFQDTMRGLQGEWAMEDIDEAIRMATGRQRRVLVRQKERMTTTRSLEDQQIEQVRDRQEQTWAREEEAFEKKLEYTEEIMQLDQEQFDLAIEKREEFFEFEKENLERRLKEYQQQHAIQSAIIAKQRKFQAEELERQKQALGIQAQALKDQQDLADVTGKVEGANEQMVTAYQDMVRYGPRAVIILRAIAGLSQDIGRVNVWKLASIRQFIQSLR